jgi:hypothetical protein
MFRQISKHTNCQAAKDATMAFFTQNFTEVISYFILGSYHSNYQQGIIWWVNKIQPGLK